MQHTVMCVRNKQKSELNLEQLKVETTASGLHQSEITVEWINLAAKYATNYVDYDSK